MVLQSYQKLSQPSYVAQMAHMVILSVWISLSPWQRWAAHTLPRC